MNNIQQKYQSHQVIARKCGCGYDPRIPDQPYKECNETRALCNHNTFLPYHMIRIEDSFGDSDNIDALDRHCALVVELVILAHERGAPFYRQSWLAHNQYGELFLLNIFLDFNEREMPTTFSCNDLERGNTLVILSPQVAGRHIMINMVNFEECFIFKASLRNVLDEADKLLRDATLVERPAEVAKCFGCGSKEGTLKCTGCKLAKYCSQVALLTFYFKGNL